MPFSSQTMLALFLLVTLAWQYARATAGIPDFPLQDYCGVGVCPTEIPNRARLLKEQNVPHSNADLVLAQSAVAGDAASPYVWADLAELEASRGNQAQADYCFRQALQLAPWNPSIQQRVDASLR